LSNRNFSEKRQEEISHTRRNYMLRRRVMAVILGIGMAVWAMPAVADWATGGHEAHHPGAGEGKTEVRLTGEVIDAVCYVKMDMNGPKHVKCAESCVKQGAPLAILEAKTGQVYLVLPEGHGSPGEKVMPYLGKQVEVTGKVQAKGGLRGIVVEKVSEKQDIPLSLPRPR
jgi:hypothetical protein